MSDEYGQALSLCWLAPDDFVAGDSVLRRTTEWLARNITLGNTRGKSGRRLDRIALRKETLRQALAPDTPELAHAQRSSRVGRATLAVAAILRAAGLAGVKSTTSSAAMAPSCRNRLIAAKLCLSSRACRWCGIRSGA